MSIEAANQPNVETRMAKNQVTKVPTKDVEKGSAPMRNYAQPHVLIVDDERLLCDSLVRFFKRNDYAVTPAYTGEEGIRSAMLTRPDVVLLDLRLPDMDGLAVLERIRAECPSSGVIIFTAHGDVPSAVAAMKSKADNFLLKPVHTDALLLMVEKLVESYRSREAMSYLRQRLSQFRGVEGTRRLVLPATILRTIELLAENASTNVLILGETGTGKGVVANVIHELSNRQGHQLVDINCAGLSSNLLESELFGHEKGAFTDAKAAKRGLLEIADRGSLFLDEVGELSPGVQAKLLNVIEDRRFRRVGGTTHYKVDVRIIAATNMDLEKATKAGVFRSDLYYRLNVMPLTLPPLRNRRTDILPLTEMFISEFAEQFRRSVTGCTAEVEAMLTYYAWPGNIRELRNVLERAVLLCNGDTLTPGHLPDNLRTETRSSAPLSAEDQSLAAQEMVHIQRVLIECEFNRSRAASVLGIHRATLLNKIKKYDLDID